MLESGISIPELSHGEGSWVCTGPHGKPLVKIVEVFSKANAERLAELGWKVETIGDYLSALNERIKRGNK